MNEKYHVDVTKLQASKSGDLFLRAACSNGQPDFVETLLKKKVADVKMKDELDRTAFFYLPHSKWCKKSKIERIVKALKKYGADINANEGEGWHVISTPLSVAIEGEDAATAEILLKNGTSPNQIAWEKSISTTPLHWAAKYGHLGLVRLLIKNRADTNVLNHWAVTPLLSAASCGRHPGSKIFEAMDSDSNKCKEKYASQEEYLEIVKLLLENGAKIDAREKYGDTPLLCAVRAKAKKIVKLLIEHGAKVDVVNLQKETTLSLAKELGDPELQKLVKDALISQKR
jgi:serine/threonine-protein phosphatase 6 regulatory ankyrin repeat subunit B